MIPKIWIFTVFLLPSLVAAHNYPKFSKSSTECDCHCAKFLSRGSYRELSFCQKLERLEEEVFSVRKTMEERTEYINILRDLRERLEIQEDEIRSLKNEGVTGVEGIPTPQTLIMVPEDEMLGDTSRDTRTTDKNSDQELAKNVSNLLAKVEEVESITSQVQEELKSEKRVRRHLEENLNETRTSIKILDDKLYNMTSPMDSRVSHVEEVVVLLENMNKTFFEDHLAKLYYKVDGMANKNETKKLDERLDLMEIGLHEVTNGTAMSEFTIEMKTLSKTLLTINQTVSASLASTETRLDELDERTRKLGEDVDDQLGSFLNITEILQGAVSEQWTDVLDNRNKITQIGKELTNRTTHLEKELENQVIQLENDLSHQAIQLASVTETVKRLDNLTLDFEALKLNATKPSALLLELQNEMRILAADLAIVENRVYDLTAGSEMQLQDMNWKIANLSETLDTSITAIVTHFIDQKEDIQDEAKITENTSTTNSTLEDEEESSSRSRSDGAEIIPCTLPDLDDSHLLMSMEEGLDGNQQLEFGCHPIGTYVLNRPSVPLRCQNGTWVGPLPSCIKLLEVKEINDIEWEIQSINPCLSGNGDLPDSTNCSYFFKCWHGIAKRMSCPPMLHFDKISKKCDYPSIANCLPQDTEETSRLRNLIPTIHVEPNNINRPYGLMGTNDVGHLIVYPSTRFSLKCLFPANRWGPVTWSVEHFLPISQKEVRTTGGRSSSTLNVVAEGSEDSGVYTCRSPFGTQNSIIVVVQAVTCPAVILNPDSPVRDVIYRPLPEGAYRILSTPVDFVCHDGHKVTAYCKGNGKWSRPPPTPDECSGRSATLDTIWGCPLLDAKEHPNLIFERNDKDMTMTFKCAGSNKLIGITYTRCYNGSWTHNSLPKCNPRH